MLRAHLRPLEVSASLQYRTVPRGYRAWKWSLRSTRAGVLSMSLLRTSDAMAMPGSLSQNAAQDHAEALRTFWFFPASADDVAKRPITAKSACSVCAFLGIGLE